MGQLRAELPRCDSRPRLYHLRDQDGRREVDIIVEYGGGRVLGLEVKATSAPKPADGRHLSWLRDELGDRFIGGIVLHTGAPAAAARRPHRRRPCLIRLVLKGPTHGPFHIERSRVRTDRCWCATPRSG
jgi:hypothetical protein